MNFNLKITQNLTKRFFLPLTLLIALFLIVMLIISIRNYRLKRSLEVQTPKQTKVYQSKKIAVSFSGTQPQIPRTLSFYSIKSEKISEDKAKQIAQKFGINVEPKEASGDFGEPLYVFYAQNKRIKINIQTGRFNYDEVITNFNSQDLQTINIDDKKRLILEYLSSIGAVSEYTSINKPTFFLGLFENKGIIEKETANTQKSEKIIYIRFVFKDLIEGFPIVGFSPNSTDTSATILTENNNIVSIGAPVNTIQITKKGESETKNLETILKEVENGKGFIYRFDSLDNPVDYSKPDIHVKNITTPSPIKTIDFIELYIAYVYPFIPTDSMAPNYILVGNTKLEDGTNWKITMLVPAL